MKPIAWLAEHMCLPSERLFEIPPVSLNLQEVSATASDLRLFHYNFESGLLLI